MKAEWRVALPVGVYKRSKLHLWRWFGGYRYGTLCGYSWHNDDDDVVESLYGDAKCKRCLAIEKKMEANDES